MPEDRNENVIFVFSSCKKRILYFPQYIKAEGYSVYPFFEFDNYVAVGLNFYC